MVDAQSGRLSSGCRHPVDAGRSLRNSIVFFPSACWHQATPVQCGTDGFEDGRWVSIGYVRRVDEDSTPERNPA